MPGLRLKLHRSKCSVAGVMQRIPRALAQTAAWAQAAELNKLEGACQSMLIHHAAQPSRDDQCSEGAAPGTSPTPFQVTRQAANLPPFPCPAPGVIRSTPCILAAFPLPCFPYDTAFETIHTPQAGSRSQRWHRGGAWRDRLPRTWMHPTETRTCTRGAAGQGFAASTITFGGGSRRDFASSSDSSDAESDVEDVPDWLAAGSSGTLPWFQNH